MSIFAMTGFVPVNTTLPVIVAPPTAGADAAVSARGAAARSLPHPRITSNPQTTEAIARLIVPPQLKRLQTSRPTAPQQVHEQENHCHNQKEMDQSTCGVEHAPPEQPCRQENDEQEEKHDVPP
jgi:hypothetical protein